MGENVIKKTMIESERYFLFLKDTLRRDGVFDRAWQGIDWQVFFHFCEVQAILGVAFDGMLQLEEALKNKIGLNNLYEWIAVSEQIKQQNILLNRRAVEVTKMFQDAGFRSCILKGQGNALMYPNPLSRTAGDIDIWIDADRKNIRNYVKSLCKDAVDGDMHISFPIFDDAVVEVHYKPSYTVNPLYEKRLQKYFMEISDAQFSNEVRLPSTEGTICVPTPEFNLVHQLSHIMGHFFVEGIGLRQFIDFYYVLRNQRNAHKDYGGILNRLGLLRFGRGVMWIEKYCLGLDDEYIVIEPDERIGMLILEEVQNGGNFGHHDNRYSIRHNGYLARGIIDGYRLVKLIPYFPVDSLWKLGKKIANQSWKLKNKLK